MRPGPVFSIGEHVKAATHLHWIRQDPGEIKAVQKFGAVPVYLVQYADEKQIRFFGWMLEHVIPEGN